MCTCIGGKLDSRREEPGKKLIAPTLITPVQPYLLPPACRRVISTQKKQLFPRKSSDHCGGKSHNPQERHATKNSFLPKLFFKFSTHFIHGSWRCSSNQLHTQDQHLVLTTDGQPAFRQRSEMGVSES